MLSSIHRRAHTYSLLVRSLQWGDLVVNVAAVTKVRRRRGCIFFAEESAVHRRDKGHQRRVFVRFRSAKHFALISLITEVIRACLLGAAADLLHMLCREEHVWEHRAADISLTRGFTGGFCSPFFLSFCLLPTKSRVIFLTQIHCLTFRGAVITVYLKLAHRFQGLS
jgi:hypothetical protein